MSDECLCQEEPDAKREQLRKAFIEYRTYIANNKGFVPNYADRHRYGELISTAFAESAINEVVSKRMVKKQQMRWTKKGSHLLITFGPRPWVMSCAANLKAGILAWLLGTTK